VAAPEQIGGDVRSDKAAAPDEQDAHTLIPALT
jgi:hypothetical protein